MHSASILGPMRTGDLKAMGLSSRPPAMGRRKTHFILLSTLSVVLFLLSYQYCYRQSSSAEVIIGDQSSLPLEYQEHEEIKTTTTTSTATGAFPTEVSSSQLVEEEDTSESESESESETEPDASKLGAIVIAGRADTNLTWTESLAENWSIFAYNVDDPNPPPELYIPRAKGHEAIVYLSYIIANYYKLPAYTIFVHGHLESWHQEADIVTLLTNIRLPAVEKAGYVPLRCDWYPSCPSEIRPLDHDSPAWGPGVHREDTEVAIAEAWDTLFPDVEIPRTISSQCCAQFAVTRSAIRSRSLMDYLRMTQWLLKTDLVDDVSGRVLEKLWAYIMTNEAVRCPDPQTCACTYFGRCGAHQWSVMPASLQNFNGDS